MRLLFVTDGRSPTSQNWIRHFAERGDEVLLASTFQCKPDFPVQRLEVMPVAFSSIRRQLVGSSSPNTRPGAGRLAALRMVLRHWFGPLTIYPASKKLRALICEVKPDIIHAMRIPYEGMLAADAHEGTPLIISVWGNDFTLHAPAAPLMKHYTRWTMQVAGALHADCERDIRLAHDWGFGLDKPHLVIPGNGGIRGDIFHPPKTPATDPIVVNPRGFRTYVRQDSFFKAIPLVLSGRPETRFLCPSMQGETMALEWIRKLNIGHAVELLPSVSQQEMGRILRRAQILISPSVHDGTPNSLLEGMACGCFPVAGDLESIREWITHGRNGLLVDAGDSQAIADAILLGLERTDLRREAAGINAELIATRAEYRHAMALAGEFYELVRRNSA